MEQQGNQEQVDQNQQNADVNHEVQHNNAQVDNNHGQEASWNWYQISSSDNVMIHSTSTTLLDQLQTQIEH